MCAFDWFSLKVPRILGPLQGRIREDVGMDRSNEAERAGQQFRRLASINGWTARIETGGALC
jgi:hypothetical protein